MSNQKMIIFSGAVVGALGVILVVLGNPANMGICVVCFLRDISGALGLHRAEVVQYLRPEIIGFILGSFLISLLFGEFRSRGGAAPLLRFFVAIAVVAGALLFLGCPLRMVLRLAAGDLNALVGLLGFVAGIYGGTIFLRNGFSLGRSYPQANINGFLAPLTAVGLLILCLAAPSFIFFSTEGPGSMAAPVLLSLGAGLLIGALAQRSRLCMAGGVRDLFLIRDPHLLYGFLMIFLVALVGNLYFGFFNPGFYEQPVAHNDGLWNFLGMFTVGFGSILLGGCPLRQLIMSGEGDSDAFITVVGYIVGAGIAHNFGLAASGAGVPTAGKIGGVVVLLFLLCVAAACSNYRLFLSGKGGVKLDAGN
ncbi:MAG: YedE family putative selenium transporter [Dethiobacteria bacterium]